MLNPTGLLKNIATGRFHPILFRPAPMPGNADGESPAQRYRSKGHHTTGFATVEEAVTYVKANPDFTWTERVWEWDGTGVPALTEWF